MKKILKLFFYFFIINYYADAQKLKLVLPIGHTDIVFFASFSPDGKYVVTGSNDQTAKIWNSKTGVEIYTLKGHSGSILSANYSPDGKYIVTASTDSTVKIWDAKTGLSIKSIVGHRGWVSTAVYSFKGKYLITASLDKTAKIWDATTGKLIQTMQGHADGLRSAIFSPNERYIVTSSNDNTAKIWDAKTGDLIQTLNGHTKPLWSASFSSDSKYVLTSSSDNTIKIWDVANGQIIKTIYDSDGFRSASYSSDNRFIVTSTTRNTTKVWDALTNTCLRILKGKEESLLSVLINSAFSKSVLFSPDNKNILSVSYNTAEVWDAKTGDLINTFQGHTFDISDISYSPMGKEVVFASWDKTAHIWDVTTGNLIRTLKGHSAWLHSASYSPDGKNIITTSEDNTIRIWNADSGTQLKSLLMDYDRFSTLKSTSYSSSGKYFVTIYPNTITNVYEASTGCLFFTVKNKYQINSASFSPDEKHIVICSNDKSISIWELNTHTLVRTLYDTAGVYSAIYSPDGEFILTASWDNVVKIWEAKTGILQETIKNPSGLNSAFYCHNGTLIITQAGYSVNIWNAKTFKFLSTFPGFHASISPDDKFILTTLSNHTAKLWNLATGKDLCTFFSLDSSDYFIQDSFGYYQCTQNAAKHLHYVTEDLKVITFEQLDVKYNRPDKVLEAIGNTDTALIKSYRKAWEKRIKKLGIDTTAFRDGYSVPEADFTNRDNIEYEQKNGNLTLLIHGGDTTYKLDRFNVWVNEVPVYGQRGISIRNQNKNEFDSTLTIKLSQGENSIEISITNVNGTESYRMSLIVNYIPALKQKETTRFIGIGIDRFMDNKYNLQYSTKDIRDLINKLKSKFGNDIVIDTLFNENVTVSNVKALKQKLLQTSENDKVIVSYSGHGLLSKDFDYYLSTYSINFDIPEENGLVYEELEDLLDSIPARKKLLLIDACHSGEIDKEELQTIDAMADSLKLKRGIKPVAYKKDVHLGLKNSFELMQSLFVNVSKSTGATVISAAAGTQFALERNDLKNGVFTYSILEALNKYSTLKISELKRIVGERVLQLTNGLQKPTARNETIVVDWSVW